MKNVSYEHVNLTGGYLFEKQELNRLTTLDAVYDRFFETGRIGAFDFSWKEGEEPKPHVFWDSDVAKWMEGAAYALSKHPDPVLEERVDALVEKIRKNQGEDGYFNIYFTVVEPELRWKKRSRHELYCAGHLMEAAVAYAEATGKTDFLTCMEKYADYIRRVFVEEKSAAFYTPGHEEIELALIRLFRYTGKKKYLELAAHFINERGRHPEENPHFAYDQSHLPVREQREAVGHAVRAMYLYTAMAYLAAETGDESLICACKALWKDTVLRKMYVTGGIGSTRVGEAFTKPYDLPNDTAYAETCAAIGLLFFSQAMLELEPKGEYADLVERTLYNGILSGLSHDGQSFFYENPLEITGLDHLEGWLSTVSKKEKRYPITQRVACFECSCCPPNLNRLLASLGNCVYGLEEDTLYIHQFVSSNLSVDGIRCKMETVYPENGILSVVAEGVKRVAIRIPAWCKSFELNKTYQIRNGYAVVENDDGEIFLALDMTPVAVYADPRVVRNAGRLCVMRGPVVYCAESVDNGENLYRFVVSPDFSWVDTDGEFGLPNLEITCRERLPFEGAPYGSDAPETRDTTLKLIPYNSFANRGESDMLVWFCGE